MMALFQWWTGTNPMSGGGGQSSTTDEGYRSYYEKQYGQQI